jgi:molybdopterin-guanine dinucleotide biosynthesis protein A
MQSSISGVILAGGSNRRFNGLTKANLVIDGETIIAGIIKKIAGFFDEIIVVTNNREEFIQYKDVKIAGDVFLNSGPLAGIHSGLRATSRDAVFVVAGDMPLLNIHIIERQIQLWESNPCSILVPRYSDNIEPLHSIYRKSVLDPLEDYLSGSDDHAVREFFRLFGVNFFDLEDSEEVRNAFANINYTSDLELVIKKRKQDTQGN